uniref:Uncharacterized protein n=1 Tax=Anguilla anguilla TaxID=7936 RepID=A0A0E9WB88_ANGAN
MCTGPSVNIITFSIPDRVVLNPPERCVFPCMQIAKPKPYVNHLRSYMEIKPSVTTQCLLQEIKIEMVFYYHFVF